jgi:hypothetical protein
MTKDSATPPYRSSGARISVSVPYHKETQKLLIGSGSDLIAGCDKSGRNSLAIKRYRHWGLGNLLQQLLTFMAEAVNGSTSITGDVAGYRRLETAIAAAVYVFNKKCSFIPQKSRVKT